MIDVQPLPHPATATARGAEEASTPPDIAALVAVLNALRRRGPRDAATQARLATLAVVAHYPSADLDSAMIDTASLGVDVLRHRADDLARSRLLTDETAREVQRRLARTREVPW